MTLARALRTYTGRQVETGPVMCANQPAFLRKKKAVRGPVQVTSLVWTGIPIGKDVVITLEKHCEPGAARSVDHDLRAHVAYVAGFA